MTKCHVVAIGDVGAPDARDLRADKWLIFHAGIGWRQ